MSVSDADRIAALVSELGQERQRADYEYDRAERTWTELARVRADNDTLREAAQAALNELGVPTDDYPAPVANAVAILRSVEGPPDENGERCQSCRFAHETVYHLPDDVWAQITPKPDMPGAGLLCPACADRRSREAGLTLWWSATLDHDEFVRAAGESTGTQETEGRPV